MATPNGTPSGVPTSSGKNRYSTNRTMMVAMVVLAFLMVAVLVPW